MRVNNAGHYLGKSERTFSWIWGILASTRLFWDIDLDELWNST